MCGICLTRSITGSFPEEPHWEWWTCRVSGQVMMATRTVKTTIHWAFASSSSSGSCHGSPVRWRHCWPLLPGDRGSVCMTCLKCPPSPHGRWLQGLSQSARATLVHCDSSSFPAVLVIGRLCSPCPGTAHAWFTDATFSLCPREEAVWGAFYQGANPHS